MTTEYAKRVAFFKEFPWLSKYVRQEDVQKVRVSRIDLPLIRREIGNSDTDFFVAFFDSPEFERAWLLDAKGEIVTSDAMVRKGFLRRRLCFTSSKMEKGETIQNKLIELGEKRKEAVYFLSFFKGEVVVYKPPKSFNLDEWIEELLKRTHAELKKNLAEIDAEA